MLVLQYPVLCRRGAQ